jgi:hypothetical protein
LKLFVLLRLLQIGEVNTYIGKRGLELLLNVAADFNYILPAREARQRRIKVVQVKVF